MNYHEIKLTKGTVHLTSEEINHLLMSDTELYKKALARGKSEQRAKRFEIPSNWREGRI
jgi:hypothetical protein